MVQAFYTHSNSTKYILTICEHFITFQEIIWYFMRVSLWRVLFLPQISGKEGLNSVILK